MVERINERSELKVGQLNLTNSETQTLRERLMEMVEARLNIWFA
ncbi:MAG: hypothetical protein QMD53_06595 [Actinomycetota bacterium]|nr:hypothetical protein [Actinomycetota bacterium]